MTTLSQEILMMLKLFMTFMTLDVVFFPYSDGFLLCSTLGGRI